MAHLRSSRLHFVRGDLVILHRITLGPVQCMLQSDTPQVHELNCGDLIPALSGVCTNLWLLWICNYIYDTPFLKPPICLAQLEMLRLMINHCDKGFLSMLALHWLMPSLRNVVIDELDYSIDSASSPYRENSFMVFGARLRYLHICPYRTLPYGHTYRIDVQKFLDLFPNMLPLRIVRVRSWRRSGHWGSEPWTNQWMSYRNICIYQLVFIVARYQLSCCYRTSVPYICSGVFWKTK